MTEFEELTKEKIRPLLKLNDDLRLLLKNEKDINVSTIIVVGDQSHGKTSVIEGLTGITLPRGQNIQTRAPAEIRIKCISETQKESYSLMYEKKDGNKVKREFTLENMEMEVRNAQTDLVGNEFDISTEPIYIQINKQNVDELTIVDLPGVTRALAKSQHGNIEETILNIYRRYMEPEETIIINIVSAMVDFSTSASLKLSNEFDPKQERTVLCMTKIDQFKEKGMKNKIDNALTNLHINPSYMFFVRNRTQEEIENKLTLQEVREIELAYINTNEELRDFDDNMKGIRSLSSKLVELQASNVLKIIMKNEKLLQTRFEQLCEERERLGRNIETEYEAINIFNKKVDEIFAEIKTNYNCSMDNKQFFYERVFKRNEKHENDFSFVSKNKINFNYMFNDFDHPSLIIIEASQSCSVLVEIREDHINYRDIINLKKGNRKEIAFNINRKPFFLKIIVFDDKNLSNIFNKVWLNETEFDLEIDSLYGLKYFLDSQFTKFLEFEKKNIGKGFGFSSKNDGKIIENVLRKYTLPSIEDLCREYIKKNHDYMLKIFQKQIDNNFADFPKLKGRLNQLAKGFFKLKLERVHNMFDEVKEWVFSCTTFQYFYEKLVQDVYIYCESTFNPKIINDHLYGKREEEQKEKQKKREKPKLVDFDFDRDYTSDKILDLEARFKEKPSLIRNCIECWAYWFVSKDKLIDNVICLVRNNFIDKPIEDFRQYLTDKDHYEKKSFKNLMAPDEHLNGKRRKNALALMRISKAQKKIYEFKDEFDLM